MEIITLSNVSESSLLIWFVKLNRVKEMETPKNSFLLSLLICLTISVTASCRPEEEIIDTPKPTTTTASTDPIAKSRIDATNKSVGIWELVEIEYGGWVGGKDVPSKKIEMTIDNSLNVVLYEESKETYRYQYTLDETRCCLLYSITKQSGEPSIRIQPRGDFRISNKKLIFSGKGSDGNDYIFQRK